MKSKTMSPIKSFNIIDHHFIGVFTAEEWFGDDLPKYINPMYGDFFVVGEWFDFDDGEKSNIEGRMTLAICKKKHMANTIFKAEKAKYTRGNKKL